MLIPNQSEIVSGPSREELFDAMRLCAEYRTTVFTLRDKANYSVKAGVVGIEPMNESGQEWKIKLWIRVNDKPQAINGNYNTTTRKGLLHLNETQTPKEIDIHTLQTELNELQRIMKVALPGMIAWNLSFKESVARLKSIIC